MKLLDFTENCLRLNSDLSKLPKKLYNQQLLDNVARFHAVYKGALLNRPSLNIAYYYVSLGEEIHPKVTARHETLMGRLGEFYSIAKLSFEFVGAKPLLSLYYKQPTKTYTLEAVKNFNWSVYGKGYVCLVTLSKFYGFISNNGGSLLTHIFEANVRDYQGDVRVNKEIGATLATSGSDDFWWLNNGITILASEVRADDNIVVITDPMIINGLQTSYKIHEHFQKAGGEDKRTILVRIIENTDTQSVDRIIKATNSQTSIPAACLHPTEEIHRKIESVFSHLGLI